MDELIDRVARELREPVSLRAGFDARVMAAVRAIGPHVPDEIRDRTMRMRVGSWLTRPRTLRVRPIAAIAVGAAAAAVFAGALIVGVRSGHQAPLNPAPVTTAAQPTTTAAPFAGSLVRFILVAPKAHRVALLGDFNHWDPNATPLSPAASSSAGVWVAAVRLPPGRHAYGFVVDGSRWVADPAAPRSLDDDFGTPTSTITVASGGGNELMAGGKS